MASAGHRAPPAQVRSTKSIVFFAIVACFWNRKKFAASGTGEEATRERERERERERNNKQMEIVVRIGKARMARNGGGGC